MQEIHRNPHSHKGDTSRELLSMWEESGYCQLVDCESTLSWWNEVGDVLLYEFNQEGNVPVPHQCDVNLGLFGNYKPADWGLHWIFWGRRPRMLEKRIQDGIPVYHQRDILSMFVGNIENDVQAGRRNNRDWSDSVELYSMKTGPSHKYSQEEYLNLIARSRFGLCLAGYGRKCNREVEYMGLGTVPIVSPEVDMNYYDSPQEGVHYLIANSPEEVQEIANGMGESEWRKMSDNCIDWWNRNCSRRGSFQTTLKIIEDNYQNQGQNNPLKYDEKYWEYQNRIGKVGGFLNLFKFESHISEEDTVLDFGCGGGYLLEHIKCKNKVGFEINNHAIKRALSAGLNVTNDWNTIPDNSIDKLISNHALEHVLQPSLVLKELHKKLKENGALIIVVPCEQFGQNEFDYKSDDKNQHVYSWCPQSLGNFVKASGFTVVDCDILLHSWTPDWQDSYMDSDYHDRCVEHAELTGVFQIKLVAKK